MHTLCSARRACRIYAYLVSDVSGLDALAHNARLQRLTCVVNGNSVHVNVRDSQECIMRAGGAA